MCPLTIHTVSHYPFALHTARPSNFCHFFHFAVVRRKGLLTDTPHTYIRERPPRSGWFSKGYRRDLPRH